MEQCPMCGQYFLGESGLCDVCRSSHEEEVEMSRLLEDGFVEDTL